MPFTRPISHSAIACKPKGESKNEIIKNTIQPVVVPAKNRAILTSTPIPERIVRNTEAEQNRNVSRGAIIVKMRTKGNASILNINLIGFMEKSPFILACSVYLYLYFTIYRHGQQCCRTNRNLVQYL